MKPKVVLYKSLPKNELNRLKSHFEVNYFNKVNADNRTEFIKAISEADGVIGASVSISKNDLHNATRLRAISTISTGVDKFDVDYLSSRNIPLMHTPNVLIESTAETIFALVICTARRVVELTSLVNEGRWRHSLGKEHYGINVHRKTMGIIGMGRIGYALAKCAHQGFDMKINYWNRSQNLPAEENFDSTRMELSELLSESDFVCVVLPLTKETEYLIGKEQFALMKPSAIFINGSRGKIIDEQALIDVLKTNKIRAAGLDVFEVEPLPRTSPLCSLNNAVLFPHIGSATIETRQNMAKCAVDNLVNALAGQISENCANIQQINELNSLVISNNKSNVDSNKVRK